MEQETVSLKDIIRANVQAVDKTMDNVVDVLISDIVGAYVVLFDDSTYMTIVISPPFNG